MRSFILLLAGVGAAVAACTAGATPSNTGRETGPSAASASAPPAGLSSGDPALKPLVDPVLADAAARLSVEPEQVVVVAIEATTWSDGALGCPKEGELYTQALVDGHRVVVSADGRTLDYRVTGPGAFRLCENPPAGQP